MPARNRILSRWKSRDSALAPSRAPALPPTLPPSNNTNDNILDNDNNDDDFLLIDEPTAVSKVSFIMDSNDLYSYKSGVTVTFSFTPKTASPSSVKLNYPPGFFSTYPTPTCTVSTQGTTMTPGVPGNNSITLSVTGTPLAAGSDVTVTLTGCKMGNSMSTTGSITVQTSTDTVSSPNPALPCGPIKDNHSAKAFVITCIDFRLIDEAVEYLTSINLLNEYDEFIVAGASLGYCTSCNNVLVDKGNTKPGVDVVKVALNSHSNTTLWTDCVDDHIYISYTLHDISEIIVIDHMSCGAYKAQLNNGAPYETYDEILQHIVQLNDFRTSINSKFVDYNNKPLFTVKLLLMRLDGTVDINPTYWRPTKYSYNLNKNDVIVINNTIDINRPRIPDGILSTNIIGYLQNPYSTLLWYLYYSLTDSLTGGGNPATYQCALKSDSNNTWYIQNLVDVAGFNAASSTYYVKLTNTLAYIKLTLSASDTTIIYTVESADYF